MKKTKKSDKILKPILSVTALSIIIFGVVVFFIYQKRWIGPVFIVLGILHLVVLEFFGKKITSVWPDIIFGVIDNGVLVIGAIIGADFAGPLGAVVGAAAANAITDGFAGIFEGWTAHHLRKRGIKEERTALGSAIGKMAGCFLGAGIILVIAWTLFLL